MKHRASALGKVVEVEEVQQIGFSDGVLTARAVSSAVKTTRTLWDVETGYILYWHMDLLVSIRINNMLTGEALDDACDDLRAREGLKSVGAPQAQQQKQLVQNSPVKQQTQAPKGKVVLLKCLTCSNNSGHENGVCGKCRFPDGRPGARRADVCSGRVGGGPAPGGIGAAVVDP